MTAENNGTDAPPEGDDPFAYLYRQDGGDGSAQQQSGVPRRSHSYNEVRPVGERQYAERPRPNAHYAAPETMPGGRAAARQHSASAAQPPPPNGGRGGRNHNGLLIGAIAVVAAVVVGIGAAVVFNNDSDVQANPDNKPSASGGTGQQKKPGSGDAGKKMPTGLPKENAAGLQLGGGAVTASDVPGATSPGGVYVTGLNTPGASATWATKVSKPGSYKLYAKYAVPGKNMHLSLSVNGKPHATGMNMENYTGAPEGAWDKSWTHTFAIVTLDEGANTLKMSCGAGDQCDVNLDRVWLQPA